MSDTVKDAATAAMQGLPKKLLDTLVELPIQEALSQLVALRAEVPDHDPELSRLDSAILPLTIMSRNMMSAGPYEIVHESPPSPRSPSGGLLQDLKEINLKLEVSALLDVEYLSPAPGPAAWPVQGVLFGSCKRALVCLPTQLRKGPWRNVIYLVDTGAPITELSPHAFEELGSQAIPPAAHANINGHRCQVQLCVQGPNGNHPDIPLLGADYMSSLGAQLTVKYKAQTVIIDLEA